MLTTLRQAQGEAPQQRILNVAAELFARDGYHATSIRDIAREVGVTPGAIYAHYPSKSRLLLAVYAAGVDAIGAALDDAAGSGATPGQDLETACRRHLEALLADNGLARVVIRVLPSDVADVEEELAGLRDRYEARFRDLIAALDLAPGTDRTLLRLSLLGALNWTQVWYRPDLVPPAKIARQLVENLRKGTQRREGNR